jgi:hypothetical protein
MMCGAVQDIRSRIRPDYHHVFNSILYGTDVLSSGSMQERDNVIDLELAKGRLSATEEELKTVSEEFQTFQDVHSIDDAFLERLQTYQSKDTLRQRALKRYYKSGTEEWFKEHETICTAIMDFEEQLGRLEHAIGDLEDHADGLEYGTEGDILTVTEFLAANGYLRGSKELKDYLPVDLTPKGIMASGVNEGNCLLLTELVINDYLDGLDCYELVAVLALFLSCKELERELNVPAKVLSRLTMIARYADEFEVAESKFSACESDWRVNREFCDMAYWWAKTGVVGRVYSETRSVVQVGEFARMMIKLNSICREALAAALIGQKDSLCMKLRECQEKLIQGVVFPQSLYVAP